MLVWVHLLAYQGQQGFGVPSQHCELLPQVVASTPAGKYETESHPAQP